MRYDQYILSRLAEDREDMEEYQTRKFKVGDTVVCREPTMSGYGGTTTEDTHDSYTSHYTTGDIECVDYLWDNMPMEAFIGGLEWNTKKYLHRWRSKGAPVKDLRKARDYLTVMIDVMEGKAPNFKEWKADD